MKINWKTHSRLCKLLAILVTARVALLLRWHRLLEFCMEIYMEIYIYVFFSVTCEPPTCMGISRTVASKCHRYSTYLLSTYFLSHVYMPALLTFFFFFLLPLTLKRVDAATKEGTGLCSADISSTK